MSLASKTSFSTNSSLYSTPCQSPGSLGSLDSTQISLTSKESLTTTGPSDNLGLLAIQDTFNSNGRNSSRPNSSSSGCSFNSVRTLLPPSSSISSSSTWKPGQLNGTNLQEDASKLFNTNNLCWQNLFQLRRDLTLKLSTARQQVQLLAHQLDELETEMCSRLDSLCQQFNDHNNSGKISPNGTFLVSTTNGREVKMSISNEIRVAQLSKLAEIPIIQKLPAMIKGYLTRRIMTTSKVKNLIKTIKDTTILLENYHGEDQVDQEEIGFHRRLMVQLEKSLAEFHDIFFTQNKAEQMKLIARTRDNLKERPWRLSTEARRQQAEKAKKFIHDKRKDSPLLTNPPRVFRRNGKKDPEKKENDKETEKASNNDRKEEKEKQEEKHDSKVKEIRSTQVPELTPEPTPEPTPVPILDEKSKDCIEEETEKDIEMKTIDEEIPEIESKAKIKGKARSKAITKPRKSAKSSKKTQANNNKEPIDKLSSPSLTSSSSVPTPPSQAPPSDPPLSSATDASEIPEDEKDSDVNKESAPKRPKRTATATKRVTRAAKKT